MSLETKSFVIKILRKYSFNSIVLILPLVIAALLSLITLPIILKSLPIEDYGKFQFVLAVQLWSIALTGSDISVGVKNAIAKGFYGTFLYVFIYRIKFLVGVGLLGLLIALVLFLIKSYLLSILFAIVFIFLILGHLTNVSYINFFVAEKQFKKKSIWEIISIVIVTLVSTLVAYYTRSIILFAIVRLGMTTMISWMGFIYVIKKYNLVRAYKNNAIDKKCIAYGLKLVPSNLVNLTSTKISSFIIGPFLGYSNLSLFYVASNLRDKFADLIRIINPLLYADFVKNKKNKLIKLIKPKLKIFALITVLFTFLAAILGYFYMLLFLPESYQAGKLYFVILSLVFPASIISFLLSTVLESQLLHKELITTRITNDILKIILILLFGFFGGIIGICIGITLSGWIGLGIYYVLIFKTNLIPSRLKGYFINKN